MSSAVFASAQAPAHGWPRGLLFSLCAAMLLAALGSSLANIALPALAQAWRAPFAQVQWVVLAYLLTLTALSISLGRLSDRLGRRRLLLAGLAAFSVASALGAACMMSLSLACVSDWAPAGRGGHAMGWLGGMSALGSTLGPALGGALIAHAGWLALFWLSAALGGLAFALIWRTLPVDRPRQAAAEPFDAVGAAWLALAGYACAISGGAPLVHALGALALLLGGAGAWRRQRQASSPLIPPPLWRRATVRAGLLGSLLVSTVMMATLVVGPFYLALGLGLSPTALGLAVAVGPLAAGRLVDRLGAARIARGGLYGLTAGAIALATLPPTGGVAGYLLPIVSMTVSYALFQTANNTAVMQCAGADQRGVMAGLLNVSRNLGLTSGAALMGAVFVWGAGGELAHAAPAAVALGVRLTFGVGFVMTCLCYVKLIILH